MGHLISEEMRATAPKTMKEALEIRPFQFDGITWIINGSCFAVIGGSCRCDLRHSGGQGVALGFSHELDDEEFPTRKNKGAAQMELPMLAGIRKIDQ
jgi:hypothetical protein